jgi:hypothetical protein
MPRRHKVLGKALMRRALGNATNSPFFIAHGSEGRSAVTKASVVKAFITAASRAVWKNATNMDIPCIHRVPNNGIAQKRM